jgi:hypothetical protein
MIADGHRHTPAGQWNARRVSGPHIKPFRHPRARFRHTRHPACATIAAEPFFAFSSKTRNGSAGRPSRATPRPASPENYPSLVSDFSQITKNTIYPYFGVREVWVRWNAYLPYLVAVLSASVWTMLVGATPKIGSSSVPPPALWP